MNDLNFRVEILAIQLLCITFWITIEYMMAQQTSCCLWFLMPRSLLLIYHVRDKWFRSEEFIWRWPCLTASALITLSAKLGLPLSLRAGSERDLGNFLVQRYFCTVLFPCDVEDFFFGGGWSEDFSFASFHTTQYFWFINSMWFWQWQPCLT